MMEWPGCSGLITNHNGWVLSDQKLRSIRPQSRICTRLQALHLFLHIGAVTVLRSKTNLIEALTNHPSQFEKDGIAAEMGGLIESEML